MCPGAGRQAVSLGRREGGYRAASQLVSSLQTATPRPSSRRPHVFLCGSRCAKVKQETGSEQAASYGNWKLLRAGEGRGRDVGFQLFLFFSSLKASPKSEKAPEAAIKSEANGPWCWQVPQGYPPLGSRQSSSSLLGELQGKRFLQAPDPRLGIARVTSTSLQEPSAMFSSPLPFASV